MTIIADYDKKQLVITLVVDQVLNPNHLDNLTLDVVPLQLKVVLQTLEEKETNLPYQEFELHLLEVRLTDKYLSLLYMYVHIGAKFQRFDPTEYPT